MKKTRRILLFVMALTFVVLSATMLIRTNVNLKADTSTGSGNNDTGLSTQSDYEKYVEEKTAYHKENYPELAINPQYNDSVVILGEDYNVSKTTMGYADNGIDLAVEKLSIAENQTYANSETAALGGSNLVVQRYGSVAYTFNITDLGLDPGFYNLYITYYTIKGFSSNIDRSLTINGEYPFSDCETFTFTRVWQDEQKTQTNNGVTTTYNKTNFEKISESVYNYAKQWRKDTNGNDIKPTQVEVLGSKVTAPFEDSMGYVTEPFEFYLDKGSTTISLDYTKEYFVIDTIEIRSVEKKQSYSEYVEALKQAHGTVNVSNTYTRIEAEAANTKSSPTLYPITDRSSAATTPYSVTKTYLNSIGGDNWKVLGDWIAWDFAVPADGYYNISMRTQQNLVRGMFSTRSVSIAEKLNDGSYSDYETLFDELDQVQISYASKWQNVTLGNGNEDYLFYFEAGKTYSLKMEVSLGDYGPLIARLQNIIDELSAIYRRIISYTTVSPDASRDYELTTKFADLFYGVDEKGKYTVEKKGEFYQILDELTTISNEIKNISGGASDKTGVIDSVVVILQKMVDKPRTIPQRLSTYSTNVSSLGSLLNELREAPLTVDYIEIHSPDVELPKANANFFVGLWNGIKSFFASFFIDYTSISKTDDATDSDMTIEVWMTLGRDQANVIRNLIDTKFTSYAVEHYGKNVNVDLKLTGGDVLLKATLAGIGPDVALNVDSSLPVNYGLRGAVLDLSVFDDFWSTVYAVPDGSENYDESYDNVYMASSIRQFTFSKLETLADNQFNSEKYTPSQLKTFTDKLVTIDGKKVKNTEIYALPEKQLFLMMFVRDDLLSEDKIPETWDDMIDLVAELQADQLQFYLPVNDSGATALNPVFVSLLYQYGGSLYTSNNMESGLKTEEAMDAFEYWTELYTNYSFPTSASFVNRFRTGEMPIGISYYEMYNTLAVFAPELKGKWSFHLIPGTEKVDANGNTYIDHTATASGTGAVLLKNEVTKKNNNSVYGFDVTDTGYAAWTFLKWWTSADTQRQFGVEMEGILGSSARHATANVAALKMLAWPASDLDMLMHQWSQVHEMPQIAGSYITGRELENAYREVINNLYNARETLYEYAQIIDTEINRKRNEFDLPLLSDEE